MVDIHLRKLPVGVLLWTCRSEDDDDDDDDDEVMPNVLGCRRHIRDKPRPVPKHGSIKLHESQKAR